MIAVFLADGFEEIEAVCPYDILKRAGHDVKLVGITDKAVVCKGGVILNAHMVVSEVDRGELEMIVLPGGRLGTDNLLKSTELKEIVRFCRKSGIYIAAICAAPVVLDAFGVIDGLDVTCYPDIKVDIKSAVTKDDKVCVDNKVITSKAAGTAIDFALSLVDVLDGKEVSHKIARDICYGC